MILLNYVCISELPNGMIKHKTNTRPRFQPWNILSRFHVGPRNLYFEKLHKWLGCTSWLIIIRSDEGRNLRAWEHEKDFKYSPDYTTKLIWVISAVVKVPQLYLESKVSQNHGSIKYCALKMSIISLYPFWITGFNIVLNTLFL